MCLFRKRYASIEEVIEKATAAFSNCKEQHQTHYISIRCCIDGKSEDTILSNIKTVPVNIEEVIRVKIKNSFGTFYKFSCYSIPRDALGELFSSIRNKCLWEAEIKKNN